MGNDGREVASQNMEIAVNLKLMLAASFATLAILTTTGSAFAALGVALEDAPVYEEADDDSEIVDELYMGEFLEIITCKGGLYCLVQSEDGEGYVEVPNLALVTDEESDDDEEDEDEDEEDDEDEE
jgi:hypothetical protein